MKILIALSMLVGLNAQAQFGEEYQVTLQRQREKIERDRDAAWNAQQNQIQQQMYLDAHRCRQQWNGYQQRYEIVCP